MAVSEQRKAYLAKWREKHRERLREYHRNWTEEHRETERVRSRESARKLRAKYGSTYWKRRNPEKAKENERRWRANNKAKIKAQQKAFYARNPGLNTAKRAKYRARQLQATPLWLTAEQHAEMEAMYRTASELGLEVDHIVPLQGKNFRGLHVPWNLQFSTRGPNAAKANRLPSESRLVAALPLQP